MVHKWRHKKQICNKSDCNLSVDDESYLLIHVQNKHKFKLKEIQSLTAHRDIVDSHVDRIMVALNIPDDDDNTTMYYKTHKVSDIIGNMSDIAADLSLDYFNSDTILSNIEEYLNKMRLEYDSGSISSSQDDSKEKLLEDTLQNTCRFRCGLCNVYFSSSDDLQQHKLTHDQKITCKICSRSFGSLKVFRRHSSTHKNLPDEEPDKNNENKDDADKVLTCAECGKFFATKSALERHGRSHRSRQGRYECDVCFKKFLNRPKLTAHISRYHKVYSNRQKYSCSICDKRFISQTNLNNHMKSHKTDKHEYKCEQCNLTFLRIKCFQAHLAKHDKKYNCCKCDRSFEKEGKLTQHMYTHDPVYKSRYECEVCQLKFSMRSRYKVHMMTHTQEKPYVCEVCGKSFKRLQQCKIHTKNLHEKRTLSCNECGKSFGEKSNLHRHRLMVHYNLRRWVCGLCATNYAYSQDLRNHLNKEHQRTLHHINNNAKKSMDQIYVFPELGTENIDPNIKRQIEAISAMEKYKFHQVYQINNATPNLSRMLMNKTTVDNTINKSVVSQDYEDKMACTTTNITNDTRVTCCHCNVALSPTDCRQKCQLCDSVTCCIEHLQLHLFDVHKTQCILKPVTESPVISGVNEGIQFVYNPHINQSSVTAVQPQSQLTLQPSVVASYTPSDNTEGLQQPIILSQCPVQVPAQPVVNNNSLFIVSPQTIDIQPDQQVVFTNPATVQNNVGSSVLIPSNSSVMRPMNEASNENNTTTLALSDVTAGKVQMLPITIMNNGLQVVQSQGCSDLHLPNKSQTLQVIPQPQSLIITQENASIADISNTANMVLPNANNIGVSTSSNNMPQTQLPTVIQDIDYSISDNITVSNNKSNNVHCMDVSQNSGIGDSNEMKVPSTQALSSSSKDMSLISNQSSVLIEDNTNKNLFIQDNNLNTHEQITNTTSGDSVATVLLALASSTPGNYTTITNDADKNDHIMQTCCPTASTEKCHEFVIEPPPPILDTSQHNTENMLQYTVSNNRFIDTSIAATLPQSQDVPMLEVQQNAYTNSEVQLPFDLYSTQCQQCGKNFSTMVQLRRHMKIHKKAEYVCEICNKAFVERFNLNTHMLSHTQDRPHQCLLCSKKFRYLRDLTDHHRVHDGTRPYSCYECNTSFIRHRDLDRHVKEQHQNKRYKCEVCGREFKRKAYLEKTHMQTHRNKQLNTPAFSCTQCDKGFSTLRQLDEHMIKDCETSNNTCKICGRHFTKQRYLSSHLKTHSKKQGRVKCCKCSRKFSSEQACKAHEEYFHGQNTTNKNKCESSDDKIAVHGANLISESTSESKVQCKVNDPPKPNVINSLESLVARYGKSEISMEN